MPRAKDVRSGPITRECPRCQAKPGGMCRNLRSTVYVRFLTRPHKERRQADA